MVKSAAEILAEIHDTEPTKGHIIKLTGPNSVSSPGPDPLPKPTPRLEPRTQASPRDAAYYAEARAYRLAALEYGVWPLLPRDLYGRGES